jgi:hypothetical protein
MELGVATPVTKGVIAVPPHNFGWKIESFLSRGLCLIERSRRPEVKTF